jgi:hypothetical protein
MSEHQIGIERIERIRKELNNIIRNVQKPDVELRAYMYQHNKEKYLGYFKNKYSWIYKEAPTLVKMALNGDSGRPIDPSVFNDIFTQMYRKAHAMNNGSITKEEAETDIGKKLFDQYVDPVIPYMTERNPEDPHVLINNNEVDVTTEQLSTQLAEQSNQKK